MPKPLDGRHESAVGLGRFPDSPDPVIEDGDYTLNDNRAAGAFELSFVDEVVATLHYTLDVETMEIEFAYCEIEETLMAAHHCRELLRLATDAVAQQGLTVAVTCPVALKVTDELSA